MGFRLKALILSFYKSEFVERQARSGRFALAATRARSGVEQTVRKGVRIVESRLGWLGSVIDRDVGGASMTAPASSSSVMLL
jgi:hypothetical protein